MRTTTTYPRNQWYAVAAADEVGRRLLARTVAGEHLVLFRTERGEPVALLDRCSHRNYPLSAGALVGDEVQCGYHGLRFDACGGCTWAPGQDRIPSRADVPTRRLIERGPWLWVWAGDPDDADPDLLPAMPWCEDDGWVTVHGMEPLAARYGLLIDNLLDLSHETFLHAGYIGTPEVAETPITTEVDDERGVVRVSRRMEGVECPPFYAESTGLQSPIDRWQDIEYHAPGCYLLHVRVAPSGSSPGPDGEDPGAALVEVMYAITPVDDHNTMDFWAVSRNFGLDDGDMSNFFSKMNREVVLQDVEALELIESRLGDEWQPVEVSFKIDTGGLAGRRVLAAMTATG
jgi:phenylpropionate dioxygenase-like ring-hydroxylating dioxygenase large terminal subunit